jgi:hypothetical protein
VEQETHLQLVLLKEIQGDQQQKQVQTMGDLQQQVVVEQVEQVVIHQDHQECQEQQHNQEDQEDLVQQIQLQIHQ